MFVKHGDEWSFSFSGNRISVYRRPSARTRGVGFVEGVVQEAPAFGWNLLLNHLPTMRLSCRLPAAVRLDPGWLLDSAA